MPSKWFVMLKSQTGEYPIPLLTADEETALFDSEEEANRAGKGNIIGEAFGFEVYPW